MRLTRRTVCALLCALIFLVTVALASGSVFATTFYSANSSTSTGDAVSNTVALSKRAFPGVAPAAVVTNADNWALSAGAGVLAHAYDGPLLLSSSSVLSASVKTELLRLKPAAVYVVGLSPAVGAQVDAALAGLVPRPQVVVLTGADAYETSVLVARQVKVKLGTVQKVVIVPSDSSGGALAGGALAAANGWPMIMTPTAGPFPQVSKDAIVELGATSAICLGTTVSPTIDGFAVEKTLTGTISGTDTDGRYSLAARVAEYAVSQGYSSFERVGVAHGYDRTGGQAIAAYAALGDGVILLSEWSRLSAGAVTVMKAHGRDIDEVSVLGLPWAVVREVKSLNAPRVTLVSPGSGPVAGGSAVVVTGTGLDTANSVIIGKTAVPSSSWRADSSTKLTILSTPAAYGSGPAEVIVQNYWNRSPASTKDVYRYTDGSPALPADKVVTEALKYLGTPYVWAGASPTAGFDCSGLTMYVYSRLGVSLPHYSRYQAGYGTPVSLDKLLPGDLVFFSNPISHVGIYVGGGLMINAPRSGDLVTIENVFRSSLVSARRIYSPYTRFQENNGLLAYAGSWSASSTSSASGGSFRWLISSGWMTVKFNGTYLGLVGKVGPQYGIAKVSIDGGTPVEVDFYSSTVKFQQTVWNTGMLSAGEHTVSIAWTGTKRAAATSSAVSIDAFDVLGSLVKAPGPVIYQQNDAHVDYTGGWVNSYSGYASSGSFVYAGTAATATVNFDGTYLSWIAKKSPVYGKARVTLDGGTPITVDLYSAVTLHKQPIYNTGILTDGPHTLTIEWTGTKNGSATGTFIGIDAFQVMGELTDGGTPPPPPPPPPPPSVVTTRYEQTDVRLYCAGTWTRVDNAAASAGSFTFANSPSKLIMGFDGTSLAWIAKKSSVYGIAKVTLDDKAPVEVDLYSSATLYQQVVYQTGELTDGPHTLTIEWTGTKNSAATDFNIGADAFDIAGELIEAPGATVFEENSPQIAYAGTWGPASGGIYASGGSTLYASTHESSATISFNGTYIAWVAKKSPAYGKGVVSLDGGTPVVVDLYSASTLYQQRVWNSGILSPGPHTLTIQWSWGRSRAASDANVSLDAVEVMGTLTQATATVLQPEPKLVAIDPGHQQYANNALEPMGPGSTTMKAKVSSGTAGAVAGPESALVLKVSLKLRDALEAHGVEVLMTRETQVVDISNAQRAQMANDAGADLFVRVHADGSTDTSVNGILMLYPATIKGWTDDIAAESERGATIALQELLKATGAKSRGMSARSDLTGFNWSDVPTFLPEIGLMTNPTEDAKLATDAYQDQIVSGLDRAILSFLNYY